MRQESGQRTHSRRPRSAAGNAQLQLEVWREGGLCERSRGVQVVFVHQLDVR